VILHWPQFLALFGMGDESPRFTLEWKPEPLPVLYIFVVLAASLILEFIPYLEELGRGLWASAGRLVPRRRARPR
jgi:hypothetical protein